VWPHCEVRTGRLHRARDGAKTRGAAQHLQAIEETLGAILTPADIDAHQAAEAGPLLPGERVVGMRLEPWVIDHLHPRVLLEPARARQAARVVALYADGQRLQPAPIA